MLRESPDSANFMFPGREKSIHLDYADNLHRSETLVVHPSCLIYTPTTNYFHSDMMTALCDWADGMLPKFPFDIIGAVDDVFKKELLEILEKKQATTSYSRSKILVDFPQILLARSWNIDERRIGISFWNSPGDITEDHKSLFRQFAKRKRRNPADTLYEVADVSMTSEEFTNLNLKTVNPGYEVSDALHLMPSEKKRKVLQARGVVPKAPIPLDQKMRREGD